MPVYVIFDVEIHDQARYATFMDRVKPAIEAAGARYLVRGGAHRVHEGAWSPRRLVVLEFPSAEAWDAFYTGDVYRGLKSIRERAATARLVSVDGLEPETVAQVSPPPDTSPDDGDPS
ncbi:hypothetical protein JANAI62_33310 [Jannaschia pagri]|uniref:DUF1330 domain-containing protein n=1 Tax=Jannaschia pagri TaxID=2829797 RepID=A0ABQ4NQQ9_9RHOB|nr:MULTISPECIES: DUF1330 domain-containing protein [unclassified Jannaschia]GIT92873.1 hypothetical protein JANAI61_33310 [Jannaschia sp. AI_61]GIT96708.1 hypothetical protein JANAI62_33310 [Jannaschia sp. AI_62]